MIKIFKDISIIIFIQSQLIKGINEDSLNICDLFWDI